MKSKLPESAQKFQRSLATLFLGGATSIALLGLSAASEHQTSLVSAEGAQIESSSATRQRGEAAGDDSAAEAGATGAGQSARLPGEVTCTGVQYYLAAAGDDEASGLSPAKAWKSIAKVNASAFKGGDCVNLKGGETFSGNLYFHPANVSDASLDRPLVVRSFGKGKATIRSALGGPHSQAVLIENVPGVHLSGLSVRPGTVTQYGINLQGSTAGIVEGNDVGGFTLPRGGDASVDILVGGSNVTVRNNVVHGLDGPASLDDHGIRAAGYSGDVSISSNVVYDIGGRPGSQGTSPGYSGNGIVASWPLAPCNTPATTCNITIERNLVHHTGGNTDQCGGPAGIMAIEVFATLVIRQNEVHNIQPIKYPGTGCDWDGIDLDLGVTRATVEENYVHNNFGSGLLTVMGGIGQNPSWGPNTFRNNVSENDFTSGYSRDYAGSVLFAGKGASEAVVRFENNTILLNTPVRGTPAVAWADVSGVTSGSVFKNNIIQVGGGAIMGRCSGQNPAKVMEFTANGYASQSGAFSMGENCGAGSTLGSWQTLVQGGDAAAVFGDPMFAGPVPALTCSWSPESQARPDCHERAYALKFGSPMKGMGAIRP